MDESELLALVEATSQKIKNKVGGGVRGKDSTSAESENGDILKLNENKSSRITR